MSQTTIFVMQNHVRSSTSLPLLRRLQQAAIRLLLRLAAAERERRERQQMAELCDATLRDLGLSRADIWAELNKSEWRR